MSKWNVEIELNEETGELVSATINGQKADERDCRRGERKVLYLIENIFLVDLED